MTSMRGSAGLALCEIGGVMAETGDSGEIRMFRKGRHALDRLLGELHLTDSFIPDCRGHLHSICAHTKEFQIMERVVFHDCETKSA